MLAIYAARPSRSAMLLTRKLREAGIPARRVRRYEALGRYDAIVCWGSSISPLMAYGARVMRFPLLNPRLPVDKRAELVALAEAGVPCPAIVTADTPGALGRTRHHRQGTDFTTPIVPDYHVERLDLAKEYRVHVFRGEVLRTARKVPREGVEPHPWVRSDLTGWKMSYGPTPLPDGAVKVALDAVVAVDYDFGAVDVAKTADGRFVVLEVNSAPGLDAGGQTLVKYTEAIAGWARAGH